MVTRLLSDGLPPEAASVRPTCCSAHRRASCHGSKRVVRTSTACRRPRLSFWTTRSRRPLFVGLNRSRRRRRAVVLNYAESTTTLCRSEPESTTATYGWFYRRCWWTKRCAVLTSVAVEHVPFWPALWGTCAVLTNVVDERVRIWSALLLNAADDPVRWRQEMVNREGHVVSDGPATVPLVVDDYDRRRKASTDGATYRWWLQVGDYNYCWWWLVRVTTDAYYRSNTKSKINLNSLNWSFFLLNFLFLKTKRTLNTGNRNCSNLISTNAVKQPLSISAHTDWGLGWA